MNKVMRFKLEGQLIDEPKPVTLFVGRVNSICDCNALMRIADDYLDVFPDIFLTVTYGYFRKEITFAKKKAIAELLSVLYGPMTRLGGCIANLQTSKS